VDRVRRNTVFGILLRSKTKSFRVVTQSSVYVLQLHEEGARRFVVMRGEKGTAREHVMVRDSDPRVGEYSLFDLEPQEWVGQCLEIATMTTSEVKSVEPTDPPQLRPPTKEELDKARQAVVPKGVQEHPRPDKPVARGTMMGVATVARDEVRKIFQRLSPEAAMRPPARNPEPPPVERTTPPEPPADPRMLYPLNQVLTAEYAAMALRSLLVYQHLEEDLRKEPELRARLSAAFTECADVAAHLRKRYPSR
jgi:hypothetical protein